MTQRDHETYIQRLIAENGSVLLSLHGPDAVYRDVSDEVTDLLGLPAEEVIGRSPYEFFHPDDLARIAATHAVVTSTNQVTTVEYRIRHADGHHIPVRTVSWSELDEGGGGHIVALTVPAEDLSEQQLEVLESVPEPVACEIISDALGVR